MLVEDNPDHADIIEGVLEDVLPDAAVEWVDHGTQAYERLEALAGGSGAADSPNGAAGGALPDLVLLDLKLPGYGGVEVLRRCRDHDRLKGLRIVMLTSSDAPEDRAAAIAAGADGYLVKSFPMSGLAGKIAAAIQHL